MRSRIVEVLDPPKSSALISLYEFKLGMNLATSGIGQSDDALSLLIERTSGEITTYCNRQFARQTVTEEFDGLHFDTLQVSLWPVKPGDILAVVDSGALLGPGDYALDGGTGILTRNGAWGSLVSITYTGGYNLPHESPPALRQAALMLGREAYYQSITMSATGGGTIRMISHKESRVMYFPPTQTTQTTAGGVGGSLGGSGVRRAVSDLLVHFTRFGI